MTGGAVDAAGVTVKGSDIVRSAAVAAALAGQAFVRAVACRKIDATADYPMTVTGMTVDAQKVGSAIGLRRHVNVVFARRVLENIFEIAALVVRAAAGGRMTAQAHSTGWQRNTLAYCVHTFLVLPQYRPPLPAAVVIGIKVAPVARVVADQTVDILQLFAAHFASGQFAETGMAGGASLGKRFAVRVFDLADPLFAARVSAEIVDHRQLAETLAIAVDDGGCLTAPLVVLAMEKGFRLLFVTSQAGAGALVLIEELCVAPLFRFSLHSRAHCGCCQEYYEETECHFSTPRIVRGSSP